MDTNPASSIEYPLLYRRVRRERGEGKLMVRKKNSDVKPQKALNSLKILYYSFLSVLSVLSVVKNSCSVILNYACSPLVGEFQDLVSCKARKVKRACKEEL